MTAPRTSNYDRGLMFGLRLPFVYRRDLNRRGHDPEYFRDCSLPFNPSLTVTSPRCLPRIPDASQIDSLLARTAEDKKIHFRKISVESLEVESETPWER